MDYDVVDGQIVLLCSDGLCGVCRDEVIGGIIEDSQNNLQECKEKLTSAALAAGGSDNITISLMQIHTTGVDPKSQKSSGKISSDIDLTTILTSIFGLFLLLSIIYAAISLFKQEPPLGHSIHIVLGRDTLEHNDTTHFHLDVTGDCRPTLMFDKTLVDISLGDSTIKVKKVFFTDTTVVIRAQCKHDTSLIDTAKLIIKKYESGGSGLGSSSTSNEGGVNPTTSVNGGSDEPDEAKANNKNGEVTCVTPSYAKSQGGPTASGDSSGD